MSKKKQNAHVTPGQCLALFHHFCSTRSSFGVLCSAVRQEARIRPRFKANRTKCRGGIHGTEVAAPSSTASSVSAACLLCRSGLPYDDFNGRNSQPAHKPARVSGTIHPPQPYHVTMTRTSRKIHPLTNPPTMYVVQQYRLYRKRGGVPTVGYPPLTGTRQILEVGLGLATGQPGFSGDRN